jgi:hypothetical protein
MNAQDFRSLQEAYMEVVMNEAYKSFPKGKVDKKMASKAVRAVGHQVAATWGDKDKSSENQEKANKLGSQAKKMAQISTEKNKEANSWSRGVKSKHKKEVKDKIKYMDDVARQQRERGYGSTTKKEDYNLYDIILSHLLDEGYAETPEAAEKIMVNMSEEWREEIVEGMTMKDFKANRKKLQRKADSDDAKKRGHVDKFTGKPYGTAEAASRRKNLNPAERESRRKFAEDPD